MKNIEGARDLFCMSIGFFGGEINRQAPSIVLATAASRRARAARICSPDKGVKEMRR